MIFLQVSTPKEILVFLDSSVHSLHHVPHECQTCDAQLNLCSLVLCHQTLLIVPTRIQISWWVELIIWLIVFSASTRMRTVNFISSAIMCIIRVLFITYDTDSVVSFKFTGIYLVESDMEVTIVNIKYIVSIPECWVIGHSEWFLFTYTAFSNAHNVGLL